MKLQKSKKFIDLATKICFSRHASGGAYFYKTKKKREVQYYNMACLVVKDKKVVSIGQNSYSEMAYQRYKNYFPENSGVHAEIAALLNLRNTNLEEFRKMDVYVAGITKSGELVKSKPCKSCEQVLRSLNFRNIYYHEKSGELGVLE